MPLTLYRRGKGKVWHYRGTVAGRRLRGSCKTALKGVAEQVASRAEARVWKHSLDGPGATLTFSQAAIEYRKSGKPTRFLKAVEDYWKDTLVKDINGGQIRECATKLFPSHSAATRNRQGIVPTQAVINYMAGLEKCASVRVRRFPVPKKAKTPATWEWVQAFMAAASPHLGGLACFMFFTGARVSEALDVAWEDIDFAKRKALIRQGKIGGEERLAHLPQPLILALAKIQDRDPERVFKYHSREGGRDAWRNAAKRAGIRHLSYHACRHGFATGLLHQKIDPITVAKRGGWKNAEHVFRTYGHAMEDETVAELLSDTPATQPANASKK